RLGVRSDHQTILVAAGLARRPSRRVVESLVTPEFALRFRGEVAVHDAEDDGLVEVGEHEGMPLKAHRAVAESDVVVVISAAVTVLHGGPAALLAASSADAIRSASAESLLEAHLAPGWQLALALERAVRRRTPLIGVSLALDLPRFAGTLRGYPYEAEALARGSRFVPGSLRARALASLPLELTTSAVFAGPPSVAHAEALVRSVETVSVALDELLDAICIGVPRTTPFLPRERPNALIAATLALGYTLRLWRSEFPVRPGGTVVLVNPLRRRFAFPTQQPYRTFFQATRNARNSMLLLEAERAAAADPRAIQAYRDGHTCRPRLPFADWDSCRPALERIGAVFVAGCRDAVAARQLGFVPTHGVAAALEMARGLAGGAHRIGFLLSPPYFPLRVGGT